MIIKIPRILSYRLELSPDLEVALCCCLLCVSAYISTFNFLEHEMGSEIYRVVWFARFAHFAGLQLPTYIVAGQLEL